MDKMLHLQASTRASWRPLATKSSARPVSKLMHGRPSNSAWHGMTVLRTFQKYNAVPSQHCPRMSSVLNRQVWPQLLHGAQPRRHNPSGSNPLLGPVRNNKATGAHSTANLHFSNNQVLSLAPNRVVLRQFSLFGPPMYSNSSVSRTT